jgi:hypothetical protein
VSHLFNSQIAIYLLIVFFLVFCSYSVTLCHSVTQVMSVTLIIYVTHGTNLIVMYQWTSNVSWEAFQSPISIKSGVGGWGKSDSKAFGRLLRSRPKAKRDKFKT